MVKDYCFATLHVLSRLVLAIALILPGQSVAEPESARYRVHLQNTDQSVSLHIADMILKHQADRTTYRIEMKESRFGDYFLAMRPFKCMTDKVNMLCHLAYPYKIERHLSADDLSSLEHDFLFIRRKPTDYGIDPWDGLIYKLHKTDNGFLGVAHEVDLNILAVPPEQDTPLPLEEAEINEIDGEQLWLPRLVITAE